MSTKASRRPLKNFFIKRSLQVSITFKIIFTVLLTSCLTVAAIAVLYNLKFKGGSFYFMSNDLMDDLVLTNILGVVLPALIGAQIISLIFSVGIGLFSSRKAAIPVYKLERWAQQIKKGRLKTHIGFREARQMKDLTVQCNALADTYRQIFLAIDNSLINIAADPAPKSFLVQKEIETIREVLQQIDYKD